MSAAAGRVDELAAAAAQRVFGHLEGERIIPRFIDSYVMGFDRPQLKNPPDKFLERSNQIGREALLLLGCLVVDKCSGEFHRFRLGPLRLADDAARQRFQEKFWQALATELKLSAELSASLAREAGSYRNPAGRQALFSGRVAPLLDPAPAMKDKAEHAGVKFFEALEKIADQVRTRVFGHPA